MATSLKPQYKKLSVLLAKLPDNRHVVIPYGHKCSLHDNCFDCPFTDCTIKRGDLVPEKYMENTIADIHKLLPIEREL